MDEKLVVGRIVALDGGGERDKQAELMRNLRKALPDMIENATLFAQLRRANYLALVKEGFTEAQALELCKS